MSADGAANRSIGGPWAALGSLFAALSVVAGAYAAHGLSAAAQVRMQSAALYLFLHGLALVILSASTQRGLPVGRAVLAVGVLLFAGSLAGSALFGWPTRLAPFGGMLMILGWLWLALCFLRRR